MDYLKILYLYLKEREIATNKYIVYLDMDGVLANFDKGKKQFILEEIKEDLINIIDNPYLTDIEIDTILEELIDDEKVISLIGKTKFQSLRKYAWKQWTKRKKFESLDPIENNRLIEEIYELKLLYNFKLGILSSTGTEKVYKDVSIQKYNWLSKHKLLKYLNPSYITFVPNANKKKHYAFSHTILIDDLSENCEEFNENGGKAIFHNKNNQSFAIDNTLLSLRKILNIN